MCLLFLYINPKPKVGEYRVVLVNNRDELYSRPTKPAHFWDDDKKILGGMDVQKQCEGGTWLAVSKQGKISCLLNIFQPTSNFREGRASRGFLVVDYLKSQQEGRQYLEEVKNSEIVYNSFNLLTLDPEGDSYHVCFYNSGDGIIHEIQPGAHGFGNCPYKQPFKKVQKGEVLFQNLVQAHGNKESEETLIAELFTMMRDKEPNFPDPQLSKQGEGHSELFVKSLSSIYTSIPSVGYGTRTTTVILVDQGNQLVYKECTMQEPIDSSNPRWENNSFSFTITPKL